MATALYVLKHHEHIGPGYLLDRIDTGERPMRMVTVKSTDDLPMAIETNGVVFAGRGLSPEDLRNKDPLLREQVVFVRTLIGLGVPYLGIDRGAQLLARAMRAGLVESPTVDLGVVEVPLTEAGRADPVLGDESGQLVGLRAPTHRFELPPRAELLAGTPEAPEAFRFGDAAWGVLPHVELTAAGFADWLDDLGNAELELSESQRKRLEGAVKARDEKQRDYAYRLMDRFLARSSSFQHVPPPLADLHLGPDHAER
jgi:GMP synthase-like glutamine amidotransferase